MRAAVATTQILTTMPAPSFTLFVRGTQAVVVCDQSSSFAEEQRFKRRGFEEICCTPSEQAGYDYAREFYAAFPAGHHPCRHCILEDIRPPAEGEHVIGRYWSDAHGKGIIFNGYLCDQHAHNLESGWRFA